jgi:hypothetical protein
MQKSTTPEQHLLAAVLKRAIYDFLGNLPEEHLAAKNWIFAPDKREIPEGDFDDFSFEGVCAHLSLEVVAVRKRLIQLKQSGRGMSDSSLESYMQ